MAGKITYLGGRHDSRNAGWVPHTPLTRDAIEELEGAIGRELTSKERSSIADALSRYRHMRNMRKEASKIVSRQSIRRTLRAITRLSPQEAEKAFENCDEDTAAEIEGGLCLLGLHSVDDLICPAPALIPQAAQKALETMPESRGGRPMKGYQILLSQYCQRAWEAYRGEKAIAWTWDDASSPFVRWASAMFSFIEERKFDPAKICKLMREHAVR